MLKSIFCSEIFWAAVGAIFTAVSSGAIIFAIRQLRFDAWLKAQEIWTSDEFTKLRGNIYSRLENSEQDWSSEMEKEALTVCRRMDEFARLIPYLPKRTALEIWGIPFAKAWLILEPIVKKERIKTAWEQKWSGFEELGRSALRRNPEIYKRVNNE